MTQYKSLSRVKITIGKEEDSHGDSLTLIKAREAKATYMYVSIMYIRIKNIMAITRGEKEQKQRQSETIS